MAESFEEFALVEAKEEESFDEFALVEGPGPVAFANVALTRTLGAPVDAITAAFNLIPGVDIDEPFLGSENILKGFKALGFVPEEIREPKTIGEHIGAGIGEVASLLVPATVGLKFLATGTGLVSKISSSIVQSMVKNPTLAIISELGGGAGVGVGRAAAEEIAPESPLASAALELGGGLVGSLAPSLLVNAPGLIVLRTGKSLFQKISVPFSKKGATFRAGEFIKGKVVEPSKVAERITEKTIGDLPPAVASGEKKLVQLYKNFVALDPAMDSESIETLSKSIVKLESEMRKFGYGSPDILAEITRKRIGAIELGMDRRVLEATSKARKRLEVFPVARRQAQESIIVRNELETLRQQESAKVKKLWEDVPKDVEVGVENTRAAYETMFDELAHSQRVDIPVSLKTDPIIKKADLTTTTVREMQGLRSKLLETARIARKDSKWNKARIADDMADAVLEDLGVVGGVATTSESASLQAALTGTRQLKTRFESGVVGKILGFSKTGAPAIPPELTLDLSIGRAGGKAAIDIDKVVVTPEARKAAERYLARSYTDTALNPRTGEINSIASDRWIRNNEAILDQFPELRSQLTDAAGAQNMATQVQIITDARRARLKDPHVSVAARFVNAADLGLEIQTVMKSPNPVRMVNDLMLKANKDQTGAAVEGLRSGFMDFMLEKSAIGSFNELGEQTLSGKTLLNFITRNDPVLKVVFTPDQISRMRKIGGELSKIESFEKLPVAKADIELEDFASSALKLFSRVGGAQIGRWVAKITGGGTVQTPGIFSERFRDFATHLTKDRAAQMITDAVTSESPDLLKSLLLPLNKPTTQRENIIILNKTMNLWLAGAGRRVFEDITEEIQEDRKEE